MRTRAWHGVLCELCPSPLGASGTVNLGAGYMRGQVKGQDPRGQQPYRARRRSRLGVLPIAM